MSGRIIVEKTSCMTLNYSYDVINVHSHNCNLFSIQVTHFDIGPGGCAVANTGSSYTVTFSDISVELEADWRRKR